jgi:hypothetical protein
MEEVRMSVSVSICDAVAVLEEVGWQWCVAWGGDSVAGGVGGDESLQWDLNAVGALENSFL